ncbi:hypothetical protein OG978_42605 (plasmid) [Streptomyces sp. NBC_01591]|uniref:hypothetical protein n=1 Tax=Streptomyces sp. NBC_01591 TaxID=2975888 RepID=UPI002DDB5088|nr:hypothetical protein [Streptomyces sp. NBC_01591]WSD73876.1 hypothetical protein OG978_42605 [Streptomyces sp. NBC_01591]
MDPRKIIELDAGHASLASQPGPVAELIETAAIDLAGQAGLPRGTSARSPR